jgi:SAM-dependent methyltransferase
VEFYEPVTPDFFTRIADTAGIDPRGLGFLDLGSGKGRALILASLHGFRRIIGVELSGAMHEVAIENVAHFDHARGTASGIELAQGDATAFDIPEGDWVVFMYNPFSGVMMGRMLRRLEEFVEAGRGRVMIWYRTPQESWRFDASEVFGRVYKEHAFAIYDSGPSSVLREGHAPPSRSD